MTFKPDEKLHYDGTDASSLHGAGEVTFLKPYSDLGALGPQSVVRFPDGATQIINTSALTRVGDVSRETNPVREALAAVLEDYTSRYDERDAAHADALLDRLVEAVERVPVSVTIRDLDMDRENIVTVPDGPDLTYVYGLVMSAKAEHLPLHLTVDQGDLKLKVGRYSWSAPIATEVYEG